MKKLYTLSLLVLGITGFAQSIVITKVVDGTLASDGCTGTSGTSSPKIMELYVSGTLDLTNYRVQTESNGAADAAAISWNGGLDLTPLGTISNSFVYLVVTPSTTFNAMYPSITLPTGLTAGNIPNGNGNDAYRVAIYDAPTAGNLVSVVDQFGDPLNIANSNDYTAAWAYQDSYASRNNGVAANGGTFVSSSFTYGGNAAFVAPNNTCAFISSAINLGSFTLSIAENNIAGLKVYPNPLSGGTLYIDTDANAEKTVMVYDVLGKNLINTKAVNSVNVANLNAGIYVVKITEEGKTATRKLVIK